MPEATRVGGNAWSHRFARPDDPGYNNRAGAEEAGNQGLYDNGKTCINCYEH